MIGAVEARGEQEVQIVPLQDAQIEPLLRLFEEIAQEEGWQPGEQLRASQDTSHYFAVYAGNVLAGGMQLALPQKDQPFAFQSVWPDVRLDAAEQTAHVAVLAIHPAFRGHRRLFWPLCVELWRCCVLHGVTRIVIEATPSMLARYRRIGFDLDIVGDLRLHWGEECYLCQAQVQAVAGSMLMRSLRSPMYRALVSQAMRTARESGCGQAGDLPY